MIDIRIFYKKRGRIKYISHLDMNRLMQRALKRSGLPVWYTQGFNPHMYLTFALPLSLGFESDYEIMDIRLTEELPMEEVVARLDAQMPPGLTVFKAAPPEMDVKEITDCIYEITAEVPGGAKKAKEQLEALMAEPALMVEKKTKRGVATVDLRPNVELLRCAPQGEDILALRLRCTSGSTLNINPTLPINLFCARYGYEPEGISYLRVQVLAGGREFC